MALKIDENICLLSIVSFPISSVSFWGQIGPFFHNTCTCKYTIILLFRYPRTVPQTVEGQMGLGEGDQSRSYSAPIQKPVHAGSDEDSSDDERSESTLSVASAGDMNANSPEGSIRDKDLTLPTETLNPLDFMENKENQRSEMQEPRPPSAPRPLSQGRPGSDRHKVLPPISPKEGYLPEY